MTYQPKPIDTSAVKLPAKLRALTEKLSENVHENWARERISEGWSYGPERNEELKLRPDLVPYVQLPESEKDYDRRSAMETLRAIIALGYEVTKPPKAKPRKPAAKGKKKTTRAKVTKRR